MSHDEVEQSSLDFEAFTRNLIADEVRIIYVGIVDSQYRLKYSNYREGGEVYGDFNLIRNLLTFAPRLVIGELEKLEPTLGKINAVLVRFEKRVLVFSRLDDHVVVVGFHTEVPTPFPEYVAERIKRAARSARTKQT
ncbi:MAG: hypothetical protein ACHQ03_02870 [Candidatus Bathyarchaeia archaeon]